MADDITQKLGFDASQAISELNKLDKSLGGTVANLKGLGTACSAVVGPAKAAESAWDAMIGKAEQLRTATLNAQKSLAMLGTSGVNMSRSMESTAGRVTGAWDSMINKSAQLKKSQADMWKQGAMLGGTGVAREVDNVARGVQGVATATAEANRQAQSFTLSWKTIGRVIQAQVIVRIMGAFNRALADSTKLARESAIAVGEISTIAGGDLGGVQQITSEVLELSRLIGLAPKEVAEGLYQTLSNQVVAVGDAIRFEMEAAKLSLATHAELKDSVNALSSAMNAYGKSADEVGRVSDVLFKGVELGRFRLEQVADIMGRTLPIAAQMCVSFEEVTAAIAVMTRQGVPVDTALTQTGQVIQKLLKPSKALAGVYAKWGVSGGKEAIERFGGLLEVLEKLKEEAAGNTEQFAKFMSRERALVGAMAMLTSGGDDLRRVLDEIYDSTGASDKAFEQMENTIGRKSVKAWNEVTIEITKLGDQLLYVTTAFASVAKFTVQNIGAIVSGGLILFLASAGTQGNILSSVFTRLAISGAAFKAVLLGPVGIVAGLAALMVVLARAKQASHDSQVAIIDTHKKGYANLLKEQQQASAKRIEDTKKTNRELVKLTADYITDLSGQFQTLKVIANLEFSAIEEVAKSSLKSMSSELDSIFKELATAGTKADKAMGTSIQEVARTKQLIDDSAFERSTRYMTEEQKLSQQMMRAQKTMLEAEQDYKNAAGNEELTRLAREKHSLGEKQLLEAKTLAESIRNGKEGYAAKQQAAYKLDEIEQKLEASRKKRIEAEESHQKQRTKLQEHQHQIKVAHLAEELKLLTELVAKYREVRDPRTPEDAKERANLEGQIESVIQRIGGKLDVADLIGVRPAITELTRGMLGSTDQAVNSMRASWTNLSTEMEARKLTVKVEFVGATGVSAAIIKGLALPDTIDPGQISQQNIKKSQAILAAYDSIVGRLADAKEQATATAKTMEEWKLSVSETRNQFGSLSEAGARTLRMGGRLVLTGKEYKEQLAAAGKESQHVVEMLDAAIATGKPLTGEQKRQVLLHTQTVALLAQHANFNQASREQMEAYLLGVSQTLGKLKEIEDIGTVGASLAPAALDAATILQQADATAKARERGLSAEQRQAEATERATEAETQRQMNILNGVKEQDKLNGATEVLKPTTEKNTEAAKQFNSQTDLNKTATDNVTTATGGISTGLGIATGTAGQLEIAMGRVEQRAIAAAQAIAAAASAASAAGSVNAQSGGRISHHNHKYFAGGGLNRGLDTIPARLSAGEFVTNTKSARRFHAQLQAINAGQTPVYRDQGGQVTNVGDIHVTVQQGNSPQQSVHEIARALNREIKRGTVRFQ